MALLSCILASLFTTRGRRATTDFRCSRAASRCCCRKVWKLGVGAGRSWWRRPRRRSALVTSHPSPSVPVSANTAAVLELLAVRETGVGLLGRRTDRVGASDSSLLLLSEIHTRTALRPRRARGRLLVAPVASELDTPPPTPPPPRSCGTAGGGTPRRAAGVALAAAHPRAANVPRTSRLERLMAFTAAREALRRSAATVATRPAFGENAPRTPFSTMDGGGGGGDDGGGRAARSPTSDTSTTGRPRRWARRCARVIRRWLSLAPRASPPPSLSLLVLSRMATAVNAAALRAARRGGLLPPPSRAAARGTVCTRGCKSNRTDGRVLRRRRRRSRSRRISAWNTGSRSTAPTPAPSPSLSLSSSSPPVPPVVARVSTTTGGLGGGPGDRRGCAALLGVCDRSRRLRRRISSATSLSTGTSLRYMAETPVAVAVPPDDHAPTSR